MKELFDHVSTLCSSLTTKKYSTSFALGIRFLAPEIRPAIYGIYGFVRLADEIVDSFHAYDKAALLARFRRDTFEAIEEKISLNPLLNSFQHVVHQYQIDHHLINAFLDSMEMDLNERVYTRERYDQYIYGSAESVGLMCLHVFCCGDRDTFERLKYPAMKLGSAFQKVNFLRDLRADSETLGRMYFPGVNFSALTDHDKSAIEQEIQSDFEEALEGIRQLPAKARKGVYLAYIYYKVLLNKIRRTPAKEIKMSRIRVPDHEKLRLMFQCLIIQRVA